MEALASSHAASAKLVFMVRPNASVRRTDLARSKNGDVILGDPNDVRVLQTEKYPDMRVVLETVQRIEERLSYAFLLNTAIQRNAERVTAEEIRFMAQELESALGGVYSILSQEMQLPVVKILMDSMSASKKIPKLPKGTVTPVIVTGVEALGRGNDLNKLRAYMADLVQLAGVSPETISRVNFGDLVNRLATGHGIDTIGLMKTEQELQAEMQAQQEAQQQAMLTETIKDAAPDVIKEAVKQQGQQ